MVKIIYQVNAQIELDTETNRQRLVKSWTQMLGAGNRPKKKVKEIKTIEAKQKEIQWI